MLLKLSSFLLELLELLMALLESEDCSISLSLTKNYSASVVAAYLVESVVVITFVEVAHISVEHLEGFESSFVVACTDSSKVGMKMVHISD